MNDKPSEESLQETAGFWCESTTQKIVMIPELAIVIAQALDKYKAEIKELKFDVHKLSLSQNVTTCNLYGEGFVLARDYQALKSEISALKKEVEELKGKLEIAKEVLEPLAKFADCAFIGIKDKAILKHLQECKKIVSKWPKWKREIHIGGNT